MTVKIKMVTGDEFVGISHRVKRAWDDNGNDVLYIGPAPPSYNFITADGKKILINKQQIAFEEVIE